jgi:hypothetical protein
MERTIPMTKLISISIAAATIFGLAAQTAGAANTPRQLFQSAHAQSAYPPPQAAHQDAQAGADKQRDLINQKKDLR